MSATDEQKSALSELAGSELRGEADRGRAILLTLAGWSSPKIAEAFGVTADLYAIGGNGSPKAVSEALRSTLAPGPLGGERRTCPGGGQRLAPRTSGEPYQLDVATTPVCAEIERQTGMRISPFTPEHPAQGKKGGSAGAARDTR